MCSSEKYHGFCGRRDLSSRRVKAAELDTSLSALVQRFLTNLASGETDAERLRREEQSLRARITAFRAADRISRDDAHSRGA